MREPEEPESVKGPENGQLCGVRWKQAEIKP